MSDISLQLVKEYFEMCGFYVYTNCKHQLQKADASGRDYIDLFVINPEPKGRPTSKRLSLTADDLRAIPRAVVDVKGWHTERFSPSLLGKQGVLSFVSPASLRFARKVFGDGAFYKILVISKLPASAELCRVLAAKLREGGVDYVLEFPRILTELTAYVKVNYNYTRSDVLQLLRLLRQYDLIKEPQMEIPFKGKKGRGRAK